MSPRPFYIVMCILLFCSCVGVEKETLKNENDTTSISTADASSALSPAVAAMDSLVLTPTQIDSLEFRLTHHYTENFNFTIIADSLLLFPGEGETGADTVVVRRGDPLVVAQVRHVVLPDSAVIDSLHPLGGDYFLIKVARDQWTMGWIEEGQLLRGVVPDDPLSQGLHATNGWLTPLILLCAVLLLFLALRFHLPILYPALLTACALGLLVVGTYLRHVVPEYWEEYYFHPTLNPLLLPPPLACQVVLGWLTLICAVAIAIDWHLTTKFVPLPPKRL